MERSTITSRTGLRFKLGSSKAASSHPHCSLCLESINDLIEDINTAGLRVHCKENIISPLLFADDPSPPRGGGGGAGDTFPDPPNF